MSPDTMPELVRIRKALERIADAAEAHNAADPLTMLAQMAEEGIGMEPPAEAFANNGMVRMYKLSDEWHIVARADADAESGYTVAIEKA